VPIKAGANASRKETFLVMIRRSPNVTGSLHIGPRVFKHNTLTGTFWLAWHACARVRPLLAGPVRDHAGLFCDPDSVVGTTLKLAKTAKRRKPNFHPRGISPAKVWEQKPKVRGGTMHSRPAQKVLAPRFDLGSAMAFSTCRRGPGACGRRKRYFTIGP